MICIYFCKEKIYFFLICYKNDIFLEDTLQTCCAPCTVMAINARMLCTRF